MKLVLLIFTFQAHAGLFDQLSQANADRSRAEAAQYHAQRDAYVESVTHDWMLRNLGLPSETAVTNEGRSDAIGMPVQYNVGGEWGCALQWGGDLIGPGIHCLSRSGQRKSFKLGPIAKASDQYFCFTYPQSCSKKARR